ncbi:hypothetical protein A5792_09295 [Mycolicibacterium peregrinum]|uniref:Pyrrolo-quinoline quinone n=1 Tax=Mycolicibacterium peregrinum TaxID=43304 RepID=A0A1A0RGA4_MYCPR|nr:hypothetical protein [Mycolicibacterium peregrinum]OBB33342.1 hypothetical protein A5792_09295 [Mycolicibacterium peregrinum]
MSPRARRWLAIGALVAVVVVAVAAIPKMREHAKNTTLPTTTNGAPQVSPAPDDEPGQLLAFPLDRALVPGWQVTAASLGLPEGTSIGGRPFATRGYFAYFLADCAENCAAKSWLFGLDTHSGEPLFAPVELPDFPGSRFGTCMRNGPATALCLPYQPGRDAKAKVTMVDLDRGEVTFTGDAEFGGVFDSVVATAGVGGYPTWLAASTPGTGLHGIGEHAELTWFVPGDGAEPNEPHTTGTSATVAVQLASTKVPAYRVFAASDGHELTPTPPPGTALKRAVTYPAGFAYQFEAGPTAGVLFYDNAGRLLARRELTGYGIYALGSVLIAMDRDVFRVFQPDGREVATIPVTLAGPSSFRNVGSQLYVPISDKPDDHRWQRWDLTTGGRGQTCSVDLADYVAGNESVVLTTTDSPNGFSLVATDMATCEVLWRQHLGYNGVFQVGDALVWYRFDQLTGLRAA